MSNKRLEHKVIIITGATKGIGRGIALTAASEGAKLILGGRNSRDGKNLVEEIRNEHSGESYFVGGDVSKIEVCRGLVDEAESRYGRLDGLVNNAGVFPRGAITETDEELFDSVFAVNVKGAFFCTKYALASMIKTGGGSIVNIGSTHGFGGGINLAAYACSKGALHTLTQHVARNYVNKGIRANYITVGWVVTPVGVDAAAKNGRDENWLRNHDSAIPSGRMQTAEDIAYGVVYLLSDESSQVVGTDLHVTGGFVPQMGKRIPL
jgi:NAD(P)-dependent dehydrogenase (short-subunit alcohol dehydrogenase family)